MFLPQRFHALQWAISLEYQTGFSLDNFPIFLCLETIYKFPFFYGETCFNTTFNTSLCYKEFLLKWEQSAQIIIAVKSYDSNDHLLGTYIFSRLLMHSRGNFKRLGYGSFLTKKLGWEQSAQIIIAVKSYESNDHLLCSYIFHHILMQGRGNFERLGDESFF